MIIPDRIPRAALRHWVDGFHVGQPDDVIVAGVWRLTADWSAVDRDIAARFAVRVHHANRARFGRIMAGAL
jgi:hypothetical protein